MQNGLVNGLNGGIPTISNGAISTLPRYLNGGTHLARELGDIDEQVEFRSRFELLVVEGWFGFVPRAILSAQ